jgi:predicted dehydrogenase
MGFPEPVSVSGGVCAPIGTRPGAQVAGMGSWDPSKYGVEDFGVGFVRFKTGATLVLEASWALNIAEDVFSTMICGTKGGLQSGPLKIVREELGALTVATPEILNGPGGHNEEIRAFVECIRKDLPEPVPAAQAIITQRILDGIYASSKAKAEVKV